MGFRHKVVEIGISNTEGLSSVNINDKFSFFTKNISYQILSICLDNLLLNIKMILSWSHKINYKKHCYGSFHHLYANYQYKY